MSTPPLNLTLPPFTVTQSRWHSMSDEDSRTYVAEIAARKVALLAMLTAISPELATPDTSPHFRADISFSAWLEGSSSISLTVGFIESGPMEVVVKNGWRRHTFKRFKVDPKTGAVDPRIVEGLRELVATAKRLAEHEVKSRENAANAAASKAIRFGHAKRIAKENGLEWSFPIRDTDTSGTLQTPGYSRLAVDGGTMKLELPGIPVERLPEVVAFLKSMEAKP